MFERLKEREPRGAGKTGGEREGRADPPPHATSPLLASAHHGPEIFQREGDVERLRIGPRQIRLPALPTDVHRDRAAQRLRIVGQGEERARLQASAQQLGVLGADGVDFDARAVLADEGVDRLLGRVRAAVAGQVRAGLWAAWQCVIELP